MQKISLKRFLIAIVIIKSNAISELDSTPKKLANQPIDCSNFYFR